MAMATAQPMSKVATSAVVNLPWVEKYRPASLSDLISHADIIATIQKFMDEDRLPHLLLYGPPGTGKTSTIKACANQLFGSKYKSMVLELNASDDRGIGVVREQIKTFASTRTVFNSGFKMIILDEADAMTNDAQSALRRIIEKYTKNVRFCLICNYVTKIIPALQSRCTRFRFAPLSDDQLRDQVKRVASAEELDVTDDGYAALGRLARGDMRKALNILQCTAMAFPTINQHAVYTCTGSPLETDIQDMVTWMLNEKFRVAFERILELKDLKGLALQDIVYDIHEFAQRIEFPPQIRIFLLEKLAEIEERLVSGTSEKIQLASLVGIFQRVTAISAKLAEA
eukprot:m.40468 g.40468  ORF g.40468 m.40468 type:complete len:342 (-) comp11369_c0_seq1:55-1080(-)